LMGRRANVCQLSSLSSVWLDCPELVVYDFACAALKTALCRIPLIALLVVWLVDRFHWLINHIFFSTAMNPDSRSYMKGVNTSSSEERNAQARKQQKFLRQLRQDNFISFSVYQQAVSNAIAL